MQNYIFLLRNSFLNEGKYLLTTTGSKALPLHLQFWDLEMAIKSTSDDADVHQHPSPIFSVQAEGIEGFSYNCATDDYQIICTSKSNQVMSS